MRIALRVAAALLVVSLWAWAQPESASQGWLDQDLSWERTPTGVKLHSKAGEGLYLVFGAGTTPDGSQMTAQALENGMHIQTDRPSRAVLYEVKPVAILEWTQGQAAAAQGNLQSLEGIVPQVPLVLAVVPCQKQLCITPPAPLPLPGPGPGPSGLLAEGQALLAGWGPHAKSGELGLIGARLSLDRP